MSEMDFSSTCPRHSGPLAREVFVSVTISLSCKRRAKPKSSNFGTSAVIKYTFRSAPTSLWLLRYMTVGTAGFDGYYLDFILVGVHVSFNGNLLPFMTS